MSALGRRGLLGGLLGLGACRRSGGGLQVAAASDLARVAPLLGEAYARQGGAACRFVLGSTGLLSRQIAEGAPFDVLLAAHVRHVDELIAGQHAVASTRVLYARGRLAIWAPARSFELAQLSAPDVRRVALANPDHAPYGLAARQALERAGLWEALRGRLVLGDSVQQAYRFAESGEAEAALVAWSLVKGQKGQATLVDAAQHEPIVQGAAACARSSQAAEAARFCRFLAGPEAVARLREAGFEAG